MRMRATVGEIWRFEMVIHEDKSEECMNQGNAGSAGGHFEICGPQLKVGLADRIIFFSSPVQLL